MTGWAVYSNRGPRGKATERMEKQEALLLPSFGYDREGAERWREGFLDANPHLRARAVPANQRTQEAK